MSEKIDSLLSCSVEINSFCDSLFPAGPEIRNSAAFKAKPSFLRMHFYSLVLLIIEISQKIHQKFKSRAKREKSVKPSSRRCTEATELRETQTWQIESTGGAWRQHAQTDEGDTRGLITMV